jgi:hypothetical protein
MTDICIPVHTLRWPFALLLRRILKLVDAVIHPRDLVADGTDFFKHNGQADIEPPEHGALHALFVPEVRNVSLHAFHLAGNEIQIDSVGHFCFRPAPALLMAPSLRW